LQKLHDQVLHPGARRAELRDVDDVRMLDARGTLRFTVEARTQLLVLAELGMQHLDGDVPLEHQVMGPEHETHSAFAQYFVDAVSVSQYRSYETAQVSHCRIVGLDGHER